MRFEGAKGVITGAASGIGRALSIELSRRGMELILVDRSAEGLEGTRALLADPAKAATITADLAEDGQRALLADEVMHLTSHLDLLVNNAGVVKAGPVEEQGADAWRPMIEVNLVAPMDLTRRLLPALRATRGSRVVNVGSMFGEIGFPFFAVYSATKFAIRGWSEALRRELAADGIGVTYCAPRGARTPAADGFARYVEAFAMRLDEPETVARMIADGVARDARDVYPMGPERLFALVQKLLPKLVDNGIVDQAAKARASLR